MLAIKLQRIGRKHQPSYRLVIAEKRSKLQGPPVEDLGFYNPFTKAFDVKKDRVAYWLKIGAKPTVSANNLLVKHKVIASKALPVHMKKVVKKTEEVAVPVAEAPVAEATA